MIEILDENLKKISILRKYTYAHYEQRIREIGTFEIKCPIDDEILFLMDKTKRYYVIFNDEVFGKITEVSRDSDSEWEKTVDIKGQLSLAMLDQRIVKGTINYKGLTHAYIRQLIYNNMGMGADVIRRLSGLTLNYIDVGYLGEHCSQIEKQVTGGSLFEEIQPVLEQDGLGILLYPEIEPISENSQQTNISGWNLDITYGVDRRMGNEYNNEVVVFSQSMSNINRTTYERDSSSYKTVAYVAGEGEDADRKWYEVYPGSEDDDSTGWNRNELWVDARDIQSEQDGETLTEQEYEQQIKNRANEKFAENDIEESYECTVIQNNRQYVYGTDYSLADWCTVEDEELGITVDGQITGVDVTMQQGEPDILDIVVSYGKIKKDPVKQMQNNASKIDSVDVNVKYLQTALRNTASEIVSTIYLSIHPVGDIVMNTTGTNPGDIYGGTWEAWGAGRTPVGYSSSDSDFNAANKTGGAKTQDYAHSHTVNAHSHTVNSHTHTVNSHNHIATVGFDSTHYYAAMPYGSTSINQAGSYYFDASGGSQSQVRLGNTSSSSPGTSASSPGTSSSSPGTNSQLGNKSVVQPYIVCYFWRRTA